MNKSCIAAVAFPCIFGCATSMQDADRAVGANQPVEYRMGYADGCDSGYVAAGHPYYKFRKNTAHYMADPLYKQGWDDGMTVCKSGYESIRRSMR